ncbi:MAG: type II toxin-antitoxin system Phd/YefM family antitoxin [Lentisphaerae bacterium]|nr:type II toxin-antitoxin system Phd/YefM family antitoxin [Lentisphaerota bacterium]
MTRINLDEDVKPLSEFRAHVTSCITQVRKTRRPVVITHHGKSAAVLLDVSEYEGLMQKMEVLEDIRLAEDQLSQGKGVSHEAALKRVLAKVS